MSNDQQGTPRPEDETQPVRPEGQTTPTTAAGAAPAPPVARRGFRERFRRARTAEGRRAFSLGAVIASALAGVIVGGLGLTAVQAIGHDGPDRGDWSEQRGPMGRDFGQQDGGSEHGRMFGGPGLPGQVQPTTPPEDDSSDG